MSPQEKIAILNDKLLKNPADGRSWNDLGVLLASQEDYPAARDAFIHALQCEKSNGDYHRNLGLVFSRLDMPEMAVAEFGEYRKNDQFGGRDYWRLIGSAQRKAGQLEEARQTYREGLASLQPPVAETFRLVQALYEMANEAADEQAVRDLLAEHTPAARTFLAGLAGKENVEAEDGWREASAIVNHRVALLVEDGKLMEQSGLESEAIGLYQDAYLLSPERPDVLPRLVDVYLKLGRADEAEAAAAKARADHADWTGTWIATGKVYEKADRLDDALGAYNKAWEIEHLEDLRVAIGNLHIRLGHDKEASEWLRAGVTADTKPEVVYNYAVSLMRGEKYLAAIPPLRTVTRELPDMPQGWQALAQCLQATGKFSEAIEPFEQGAAAAAGRQDRLPARQRGAEGRQQRQGRRGLPAGAGPGPEVREGAVQPGAGLHGHQEVQGGGRRFRRTAQAGGGRPTAPTTTRGCRTSTSASTTRLSRASRWRSTSRSRQP
ncbi:MAG: tetratricopeptide repeat protein [bacterium]|nr:tetratricopeptide repeat protein [bacterium]